MNGVAAGAVTVAGVVMAAGEATVGVAATGAAMAGAVIVAGGAAGVTTAGAIVATTAAAGIIPVSISGLACSVPGCSMTTIIGLARASIEHHALPAMSNGAIRATARIGLGTTPSSPITDHADSVIRPIVIEC